MAEMLIDENTNKPFARLGHDEMVRALLLATWHSVGSSVATLASGEARDSLSAVEDIAATYITCRIALTQLEEHLEDCPERILKAPLNKAPLEICTLFHDLLKEDDLNTNKPESPDEDRVLFFVKLVILWVDLMMRSMDQTKGRKARAVVRGFVKAVAEVAKEHGRVIDKPKAQTAPS
jgi:hypothetical protein